eukprot:5187918-Pyramimonas_sp.AAC.1
MVTLSSRPALRASHVVTLSSRPARFRRAPLRSTKVEIASRARMKALRLCHAGRMKALRLCHAGRMKALRLCHAERGGPV